MRIKSIIVEICLLILVIGVLSAMAIPTYRLALVREKQKEAFEILNHIWAAKQDFYSEFGKYGSDSTAQFNLIFIPAINNNQKQSPDMQLLPFRFRKNHIYNYFIYYENDPPFLYIAAVCCNESDTDGDSIPDWWYIWNDGIIRALFDDALE